VRDAFPRDAIKPEPRFATGLVIAADPALHRDILGALR
jgi:hypothetical protein